MQSVFQDDLLFFLDEGRDIEPLPGGVQATIKLEKNNQVFNFQKSRTVLGRGDVDFRVQDLTVSEKHAVVGYFDGFFFVIDLESKNHTFVNGKKVVESLLSDGDTLQIGEAKMRFTIEGEPEVSVVNWPKDNPDVGNILEVMFGEQRKALDDTRIMIRSRPSMTSDPALVEVQLEVMNEETAGRIFKFVQGEVVIGRNHGDLPLEDPDVSKRQCAIEVFGPGQVFLKDLESTNGTFLNSTRIKRSQIAAGDLIQVGSTQIRVGIGQPQAEAAADPSAEPRIRLKVISGYGLGKMYEAACGKWTLGKEQADILLPDPHVNDLQARLVIDDLKMHIEDVGGGQGVHVNGKKIKRCVIDSGDVVQLGKTTFKIESLAGDEEKSLTAAIRDAGYDIEEN